MKTFYKSFLVLTVAVLIASCGRVEQTVAQVSNSAQIDGNWVMTESSGVGPIAKWAQDKALVLTFKNGNAAFSRTSGFAGNIIDFVSVCDQGPRPFNIDGKQIVFPANNACPEKRVAIQQLDGSVLRFLDPGNNNIVRNFERLTQQKYEELVLPVDRKLNL